MRQTRPIPRMPGTVSSPGQAPRDQRVHAAAQRFGVRVHEPRPRCAGEPPAVEADERDPRGLFSRPAKRRDRVIPSPQMSYRPTRPRVELPFPRLDDRNGEEPFAGTSTLRKSPKLLWRSETFSTVRGLLDTAASGLSNAPLRDSPRPHFHGTENGHGFARPSIRGG